MNKLLRIIFIIAIVTLLISAAINLFLPNLVEDYSNYAVEKGWQRKIGSWKLAILPILISIQFKYDYHFLIMIIISLFLGYVGLGTNHVLHLMNDPGETMHVFGSIGNYLFALLLILGWIIESSRYRKDIKFKGKDQIKWAQF